MNPLDLESEWNFAEASFEPGEDLVAIGADLEPGTIVAAYAQGVFPMGLGEGGAEPMGWWSPCTRGVLRRGGFHPSRSLRRSAKGVEITVDQAFTRVVEACADPRRDGAWITDEIAHAYGRLHELGIAHSVEVWGNGDLVGGLYGLAVGGLFAGESMFHHRTDASKLALWALSDVVFAEASPRLIDVQWQTPHLASLGVIEMSRETYRSQLTQIVTASPISGFIAGSTSHQSSGEGRNGTPILGVT